MLQVTRRILSLSRIGGLLKPYRNVLKLRQLRAHVSAGRRHSFPLLAHKLSKWRCKDSHDRLNALYELVSEDERAWFLPRYSISSPELYTVFAKDHIRITRSLEILHFAGYGGVDVISRCLTERRIVLEINSFADDIASWVPDWRVQSSPLTLLTIAENKSAGFSATESDPEFKLNSPTLRVRAREVDRIKVCGLPYGESFFQRLHKREHTVFNQWYGLAKKMLTGADVEKAFASTLLMDGKVAVMEHEQRYPEVTDVMKPFENWAIRNLVEVQSSDIDWRDGIDDSARYGYIAEEICRDRTFFITEAGRLGLDSVYASPGDSIFLIHGLKVSFVVHHTLGTHALHGECYISDLMYGRTQHSDQDSFLYLR